MEREDPDPRLIHGYLGPPKPNAKQHLDRYRPRACPGRPYTRPLPRLPFPLGRYGLLMVTWTHPNPHAKRHLDRFSRSCRVHSRYVQTYGQTHTQCVLYIRCGIKYKLIDEYQVPSETVDWFEGPDRSAGMNSYSSEKHNEKSPVNVTFNFTFR